MVDSPLCVSHSNGYKCRSYEDVSEYHEDIVMSNVSWEYRPRNAECREIWILSSFSSFSYYCSLGMIQFHILSPEWLHSQWTLSRFLVSSKLQEHWVTETFRHWWPRLGRFGGKEDRGTLQTRGERCNWYQCLGDVWVTLRKTIIVVKRVPLY